MQLRRCHAVKYRHRLHAGSPRWCLPCPPSPAGSASASALSRSTLHAPRLPGIYALPRFPRLPPDAAASPRHAGTKKGRGSRPSPSASLALVSDSDHKPAFIRFRFSFCQQPEHRAAWSQKRQVFLVAIDDRTTRPTLREARSKNRSDASP